MIKPLWIKRITVFLLFVFAFALFGAAYTQAIEEPALTAEPVVGSSALAKA